MNSVRVPLLCLCAALAFAAPAMAQKKNYYYQPVTKESFRHSSTAEVWRDEDGDGVNDANQAPRTKTTYHYNPVYRDRHLYSPYRYQPNTRYSQPAGHQSGKWWGVGNRMPAAYYAPSYSVDYRRYRLPEPQPGLRWVRVEKDVYLVHSASGQIRDALYSLFY